MAQTSTTDFYVYLLFAELTYHIAKREGTIGRISQGEKIPTVWEEIFAEYDAMDMKLKKSGEYFHESGGSVFIDYKNLRGRVVPENGMQEITTRFSSSMSKDEFLRTAREIVEEWQTRSGMERER